MAAGPDGGRLLWPSPQLSPRGEREIPAYAGMTGAWAR